MECFVSISKRFDLLYLFFEDDCEMHETITAMFEHSASDRKPVG